MYIGGNQIGHIDLFSGFLEKKQCVSKCLRSFLTNIIPLKL